MKRRKKGFTLIEIIVCLVVLSLIGTVGTVSVKKVFDNNKQKELNNINKNLYNALEVYLDNHEEVERNIMLNSKAAIITLEALKNEGLIDDKLYNPVTKEDFNLKNSYFTLVDGSVEFINDPFGDVNCDNNQIPIQVISSWDLSNLNTSNVMYICPRKDWTNEIADIQNDINSISSQLGALETKVNNIESSGDSSTGKEELKLKTLYEDLTYTAAGTNPNNYVEFEVVSKSSDLAYFPNNTQKNLWRIISINDNDEIKLIYSQPVKSNNFSNYKTESSTWCDHSGWSETTDTTNCTFYKLKHASEGSSSYYRYNLDDGFVSSEVTEDVNVSGSKKEDLYNSIVKKNWLISGKYYPKYTVDNSGNNMTVDLSNPIDLKMGMLSPSEITSSIKFNNSWLYNFDTIIGSFDKSVSFNYYYQYAYVSSGNFSNSRRKTMANRCTNSSCSRDEDSSSHWYLYTYNYYPVIILNSKVDIVEPECGTNIVGSSSCPYKLTCSSC